MSMIVFADRTGSLIADENSSPSETFVLQPDAGSDTSETFRLERLHRLIRQRELDLLSSSGLDILSSGDDEDEEVGNGSSVLVEATTTRNGEVHSQYLFEDIKVFTNGFCKRHLGLSSDWGYGGGQGMTGRVFGWLGIKDGVGFAPGGNRG
jgi:hypothetical protein